jgi:hypothetical protein
MIRKAILWLGIFGALGFALIAVADAGAQQGSDGPVRNFIGRVAEKLGVSEDELSNAVKEVELEMIDEALAEGRITEEQAAEMRQRVESGELRFPGGGPRHHPGRCLVAHQLVEETARILGIEEAAVIDALQDGQSLAQIAEANGMGAEEYKAALTEAAKAKFAQAVENGRITQERADQMLAKFTENLDRIINHEPDADGPRPCRRLFRDGDDVEPSPEAEGTRL